MLNERNQLLKLQIEVDKCTACAALVYFRNHTVFGTGPLDARIAIVGEGYA